MDVLCPRCGEPWDTYEFHEVAAENGSDYGTVSAAFRRHGCGVFGVDCEVVRTDATAAARACYDILGDDMDGAAAMLEDFGF